MTSRLIGLSSGHQVTPVSKLWKMLGELRDAMELTYKYKNCIRALQIADRISADETQLIEATQQRHRIDAEDNLAGTSQVCLTISLHATIFFRHGGLAAVLDAALNLEMQQHTAGHRDVALQATLYHRAALLAALYCYHVLLTMLHCRAVPRVKHVLPQVLLYHPDVL